MSNQMWIVEFGDDDPEDGWDAGDPIDVKVEILKRTVDHIETEGPTSRQASRRGEAVRLCHHVLDEMDRTPHDQDDGEVHEIIRRLGLL